MYSENKIVGGLKYMHKLLTILLLLGSIQMTEAEDTWTVGHVKINGFPVVYKFLSQLPNNYDREKMSWLTVIT